MVEAEVVTELVDKRAGGAAGHTVDDQAGASDSPDPAPPPAHAARRPHPPKVELDPGWRERGIIVAGGGEGLHVDGVARARAAEGAKVVASAGGNIGDGDRRRDGWLQLKSTLGVIVKKVVGPIHCVRHPLAECRALAIRSAVPGLTVPAVIEERVAVPPVLHRVARRAVKLVRPAPVVLARVVASEVWDWAALALLKQHAASRTSTEEPPGQS